MKRAGGDQGAARRYARALLDVAKTDADALQAELAAAGSALNGSAELQRVLGHPALPAERRRKVAAAVFTGSPLLGKLVAMLLERDRIALLPEISRQYTTLWNEQRGVIPAEAVTAAPMDTKQAEALGQALADATGKQVALRTRVDPTLLGGVMVHMAGRTYDGSVRTRLLALRERLTGPIGA